MWAFRRLVVRRPAALSVECVAHPRGPPDDLDVFRRGPSRPDVLALPEIARTFNCWEVSAQTTSTAAPLWSLSQVGSQPPKSAQANPGSSSTSAPALTHRTIGVGGAAVGEPADTRPASPRSTSAAAAARHPRRRGESAAVSSPHAGEPKTAPSCSGIDVASPHQWWRGAALVANSGQGGTAVWRTMRSRFPGGELRAVLRLAVRPRTSPGSAMRRFRNRSNVITATDHGRA